MTSSSQTPITVQSLGSGSSGNAFIIERGETTFLLDCGVGIRTLKTAMKDRAKTLADLDAVLLTHEHIDHVRTLPSVLTPDLPVIATSGTMSQLRIDMHQWQPIDDGSSITVAGAEIWSLPVAHDAADPCGYCIVFPEGAVTILTDLGTWHESLAEFVVNSSLVVLEANHDVEMLRRGPYPIHLKKRVASNQGHLSNEQCGNAVGELADRGKWQAELWLAHLSETNNRPEVAQTTVDFHLGDATAEILATPLPRRAPGPIWKSGRGTIARPQRTWSRPVTTTQLGLNLTIAD